MCLHVLIPCCPGTNYRCIHDTFTIQVSVLWNAQAATALGVEMVDVKEADQKDSQAVHGLLSKKKTATTPVPTETVVVPVTTVPAVAVSGIDTLYCELK